MFYPQHTTDSGLEGMGLDVPRHRQQQEYGRSIGQTMFTSTDLKQGRQRLLALECCRVLGDVVVLARSSSSPLQHTFHRGADNCEALARSIVEEGPVLCGKISRSNELQL